VYLALSRGGTKTCGEFLFAVLWEKQLCLQTLATITNLHCKLDIQITPLHAACTYGSNNMVKLLLKYGAAVSYRDECNNTPLDLAIKHGHKVTVVYLLMNYTHYPDK